MKETQTNLFEKIGDRLIPIEYTTKPILEFVNDWVKESIRKINK